MENNNIQFTPNQLPEIKPISNSNTFKYLFILFFILFLVTLGVLVTIISDKNKTPDSLSDNQVLPTQVVEVQTPDTANIQEDISSDNTLDWKTHQSSQLGFKVKYPSNWYFSGDVLTSYEMEIQTKEFMLKIDNDPSALKCDFYTGFENQDEIVETKSIKQGAVNVDLITHVSHVDGPGATKGESYHYYVFSAPAKTEITMQCWRGEEANTSALDKIIDSFEFI